jgi:hypothetical protein
MLQMSANSDDRKPEALVPMQISSIATEAARAL